MLTCPFCGDNDFDLVGLKGHLLNWCEVFEQTETPLQERFRKERESAERPRKV
jgi:hypothetical protein